MKVKTALEHTMLTALKEAIGEVESQVKKNTPVGKLNGGQLRGSWKYNVSNSGDEYIATIGSPLERALWIEFGTGEYALPESGKSGRKGGWYIPIGPGEGQISETVVKRYGMAVRNGKNGNKWVFTLGMKPQRPLFKAYSSKKNKMVRIIQNALKGGLS